MLRWSLCVEVEVTKSVPCLLCVFASEMGLQVLCTGIYEEFTPGRQNSAFLGALPTVVIPNNAQICTHVLQIL